MSKKFRASRLSLSMKLVNGTVKAARCPGQKRVDDLDGGPVFAVSLERRRQDTIDGDFLQGCPAQRE